MDKLMIMFLGYINIDRLKDFYILLFLSSLDYFYITVLTDPLDHATGLEKRELLARAAGNDNPFDMKVFKRGPGTKENPNLIPSAFDARLVGCICKDLVLKACE